MTAIIYTDKIEELVKLLIEQMLFDEHKGCTIKYDDRKRITRIIDAVKYKHHLK
jgi:hypothetical protein